MSSSPQIHHFPCRFQPIRLRGFACRLVLSDWILHGYDEENEPTQTKPFKGCLSQSLEKQLLQGNRTQSGPNQDFGTGRDVFCEMLQ